MQPDISNAIDVFLSYDYEHDIQQTHILQSWFINSDFKFYDEFQTNKAPYSNHIRNRIDKCDLFICLIGEKTHLNDRVNWEINTAQKFNKRIIAIPINPNFIFPNALENANILSANRFTYEAINEVIELALATQPAETIAASPLKGRSKFKILVVDDEPLVLEWLLKNLNQSGFDVITANDGRRALLKVKEENVDLVILDYRMPDIDGLEVLRQIKLYSPTIPVIMITAYASKDATQVMLEAGAEDVIYKPLKVNEFIYNVKKTLELRNIETKDTTGAREIKAPESYSNLYESSESTKYEKILIVDDEQDIVKVLSKILELEGYNILTAFSGTEAIKIANDNKPSLVLLDYLLPDINGLDVLQELKRISEDAFVVMVSGRGNEEVAASVMKAGASDYVIKPFTKDQIITVVKDTLRIRRAEIKARNLQREVSELHRELEHKVEERTSDLIENNEKRIKELESEVEALKNHREKANPRVTTIDLNYATSTPNALSDKWIMADSLGYEVYARAIAQIITHEETKPPLTIGIKAPWGAGKTSLMKNLQHILDGDASITEENEASRHSIGKSIGITIKELIDSLNKPIKFKKPTIKESAKGKKYGIKPRATVWFNAWKYQTSEQIWAGMAHCIINQVTARMEALERERFWFNLHARRLDFEKIRFHAYKLVFSKFLPWGLLYFGVFIIFLLINYFKLASGMIGISFIHFFIIRHFKFSDRVSGELEKYVRAPDYAGKLGFLHLVESDMRAVLDLVANEKEPLVIFVDDLDRCSPNKVAEVVEAINLFLSGDYPNCIFVMGMEPAMVAAAIKVANRAVIEEIDADFFEDSEIPLGWRFMEKVVQLPIIIPAPTETGVTGYLDGLIGVIDSSGQTSSQHSVTTKEEDIKRYIAEFETARNSADVNVITNELFMKADDKNKAAIAEASKQMYSLKFKEKDPSIREFVETAVPYFKANPRQIKRYINLFRFLCVVRQHIIVDKKASGVEITMIPSDKAISKFVVLCALWPLAVDLIKDRGESNENGEKRSTSIFFQMEDLARSLEKKDVADAKQSWEKFLSGKGINTEKGWCYTHQFRKFLASDEPLSKYAGFGLW